jgi:hypothetical protein
MYRLTSRLVNDREIRPRADAVPPRGTNAGAMAGEQPCGQDASALGALGAPLAPAFPFTAAGPAEIRSSNVEPLPTVLFTRTEPWWASAIAAAVGSPSPNPPASRLR